MRFLKWLYWTAVGLFAACVIACGGGGGITKATKATEDAEDAKATPGTTRSFSLETDARLMAEDYVKQFLKFPHDASFPWFSKQVRGNPATGVYHVSGQVKAANAFGAQLTHEYSVELHHAGGKWSLAVCTIDDEVVYLDQAPPDAFAELQKTLSEATEPAKTAPAKRRRRLPPNPVKETKPTPPPEYRTWTDATGEHKTEAVFRSYGTGQVTIEKKDGETAKLSMDRLSEADQAWVREHISKR